jgi:putative tricarboxylic transport membrane protein
MSISDAPATPRRVALNHALIGAVTLVIGGVWVFGAMQIPGEAGYAGIGPNFLPWVVGLAVMVCGAWLVWQALHGGFTQLDEPSGAARGDWRAFAWVSAGVLANAALITTVGFVFACALCFVLAVRGLRASEGRPGGTLRQTLADLLTGLAIAAPVFWLFSKVLAINLPRLTSTGWL